MSCLKVKKDTIKELEAKMNSLAIKVREMQQKIAMRRQTFGKGDASKVPGSDLPSGSSAVGGDDMTATITTENKTLPNEGMLVVSDFPLASIAEGSNNLKRHASGGNNVGESSSLKRKRDTSPVNKMLPNKLNDTKTVLRENVRHLMLRTVKLSSAQLEDIGSVVHTHLPASMVNADKDIHIEFKKPMAVQRMDS